MEIQDIRRKRLREWLEGRTAPPKEKSYFSQLLNGTASFGERAARRLERDYGMGIGFLDAEHNSTDTEKPIRAGKVRVMPGSAATTTGNIYVDVKKKFDENVAPAQLGQREVPVISYIQAGLMTEIADPFALGEGFEKLMTDVEVSDSAFGLIIKGLSMLPEFKEGDKVVIDPAISPQPGDYVAAKTGEEEATFKKYRPRGTNDQGNVVFELVPLNDDFPTLHSERDHMRVIGVMVEHRKYRKR